MRTALNLLYPKSAEVAPRVRAVSTKKHGANIVRRQTQASFLTEFETFDVNRLVDVVNKADGVPADMDKWGRGVSGGDALFLKKLLDFREIGRLCLDIERTHSADDYKEQFDWIDYIQPVAETNAIERLRAEVIGLIADGEIGEFHLGPAGDPRMGSWIEFSFFGRNVAEGWISMTSPDLRLDDYLRKARRRFGEDGVTFPRLQSGRVIALDGSGSEAYSWSVWKCLTGAVDLGAETFVLDEGQFFRVHQDYMEDLDSYVDQLPNSSLSLPPNPRGQEEGDYNAMVASSSSDLLLLDRQNVKGLDQNDTDRNLRSLDEGQTTCTCETSLQFEQSQPFVRSGSGLGRSAPVQP